MAPPDVPPATSASQLVTYANCPRKYAFQHVWGAEPEFRSVALVMGSALHSAIGWFFEERLAGREPTIDSACSVLAADLVAGAALGDIRWKDKTPESLEEEGRRLVTLYLEAYRREPLPNAFGVSQAVTLAAQGHSPEERLELEEAAGRYIASAG